MSRNLKYLSLFLVCLAIAPFLFAHVVVRELEDLSKADTLLLYLKLGYRHILPLGFDHILFVLSLFLFSTKLKPVLLQSLAFTLAHSVTLGLAMYHVVKVPAAIVEPLIALSIAYVALENVFSRKLKASRIVVIFCFGLVHGLGFASALSSLGLPQNAFFGSLVMFNLGVELGQLTVILGAFLLMGKWFGDKPYYKKYMVNPFSLAIASVALFLVVQRLLV